MHWRPLSPDVDSVHRLQLLSELGAQEHRLRLVKLPPHLDIVDNIDIVDNVNTTSRRTHLAVCPVWALSSLALGVSPASWLCWLWSSPLSSTGVQEQEEDSQEWSHHHNITSCHLTSSPDTAPLTAGDSRRCRQQQQEGAGKYDVWPRRRRSGARGGTSGQVTLPLHTRQLWIMLICLYHSSTYIYIYKHVPQKFNTFSLNQMILFQYFQLLNLPSFVLQFCLTRECLSVMKGDVYWKLMPFARFSTSLSFLCLLKQ